MATEPILRVSDLKQWAYCRRIAFYQLCKPLEAGVTEPMREGKRVQDAIERLEQRRKVREYGLESAERLFGLTLVSDRLGLSGQIDLALRTPTAVVPVDFKHTTGPPRPNHGVQLCAYGLLLEEHLSLPALRGFVYRVPDDAIFEVAFDESLRATLQQAIADIKDMVAKESFPEPADSIAKCLNCEYLNFCNDRL